MNKKQFKLYKNQEYSSKKIRKNASKNQNIEYIFIDKSQNQVHRKLIYENLEEGFSKIPQERFCDITGYETRNQHPKSELFYLNRFVFKYVKNLPLSVKEEFRSIRNLKRGF